MPASTTEQSLTDLHATPCKSSPQRSVNAARVVRGQLLEDNQNLMCTAFYLQARSTFLVALAAVVSACEAPGVNDKLPEEILRGRVDVLLLRWRIPGGPLGGFSRCLVLIASPPHG